MRTILSILLALTLVTTLSSQARGDTVAYAIVIGNNATPIDAASEQLSPLRYADDDAVRYHQLFSRLGTSRLLVVLDKTTQRRYPGLASIAEPPTLETLRQVVATYAASMKADKKRGDKPVLYFAFSGHGARDKSGAAFLAMMDGSLTQDILFDEIIAELPSLYSHLMIDACNAGGVVGVRGGFFDKELEGQTAPVTPSDVLPILESRRIAAFPHVGVILATTLGQEAHEWSEVESGVFTHELLSGLLGPADVNGDLNVEYTEVQAFVAAANRGIKDPRAIPQVIARPPTSNQNVPLISLNALKGTRVLKGEVGSLGHFHIELINGQRYLDAHLVVGSKATVVVPLADAFLRTDTHEVRIPSSKLVAFDALQLSKRKIAARGSIDSAYRTSLFSSEYGRNYYQGYVDSIAALGVSFSERTSAVALPQSTAVVTSGPSSGVVMDTPSPKGNRTAAIAAASVSGVSAIAAITTGVLAFNAKNDYADTELQTRAQDAKQRYERYRTISIVTGVSSIAGGVAAYWLWPETTSTLVPSVAANGDFSVSIGVSW